MWGGGKKRDNKWRRQSGTRGVDKGGGEVQLVVEREDLYLPTNPESRLLAVVPDSATPMQSAAKVPILVAFRVRAPLPTIKI